jgi:hypothetical protein
MFKSKKIEGSQVNISICKDVLEAIFAECDCSNIDETGGRIIGYGHQDDNKLNIKVCGLIGPGPNARRSPTSFFQDGEYQETIFRKIEAEYPEIEHLGNWHTHHVNGLSILSSGDIHTYKRIVNHEKHNTDFFYALLVVSKNQTFYNRERYLVKHFLFKRGESSVSEIPSSQIKLIKEHAVFVEKPIATYDIPKKESAPLQLLSDQPVINQIRATDKEIISAVYPGLKTFFSKQTKCVYWRGEINLIDNTAAELFVLESINEGRPSYSIALAASTAQLYRCHQLYLKRTFDSAWKAVYLLERDLNCEIFGKMTK